MEGKKGVCRDWRVCVFDAYEMDRWMDGDTGWEEN